MNADIIELNDLGLPGESRKVALNSVPRIGELIALGDNFFEVVNVIHKLDAVNGQAVSIFIRPTKAPYQEPKSRFGFGSR